VGTKQQQETRTQIATHEREATLLRANPPAAEAAQRERQAAEHDRQAWTLRERLTADVAEERKRRVAERDRDQVRVRFVRDLAEAWVDGRVYSGRGPVRQRLGQAATHTATVAPEVAVQPGEEQVMPRAHAEVLGSGAADGYVRIIEPAAAEVTG